jgi:hypothetical protein
MVLNPPECAVCGRAVESMRHWADASSDSYVFQFTCHGDEERVVIRSEEIESSDMFYIGGKCFASRVAASLGSGNG